MAIKGSGTGAGPGGGRGGGRGGRRRQGRMGGNLAAGPGGLCVCPSCGYKEDHVAGKPCFDKKCPKCGNALIRE
jgi:hypothetical protein